MVRYVKWSLLIRLIKNLHFIPGFSSGRLCAAGAPPPSDRTNSKRRSFFLELGLIRALRRQWSAARFEKITVTGGEALRCEVTIFETLDGNRSFFPVEMLTCRPN